MTFVLAYDPRGTAASVQHYVYKNSEVQEERASSQTLWLALFLLIWCSTGFKSCRSAKWRHFKSNLKAIAGYIFFFQNEISTKKLRISFSEFNKWLRSLSIVWRCHSDRALNEISNWRLQLLSKKQGLQDAVPARTLYKQIQKRISFFLSLSQINTLLKEILSMGGEIVPTGHTLHQHVILVVGAVSVQSPRIVSSVQGGSSLLSYAGLLACMRTNDSTPWRSVCPCLLWLSNNLVQLLWATCSLQSF